VLQSGDKALLFGAGGWKNRFPIVFHNDDCPAFGVAFVEPLVESPDL
jgi:hypothetical protein